MAKYTDVTKLGSGGFAEVYRCRRVGDGEFFARKILAAQDEESLKRFCREVRILSKLDHPRIIKIVGKNLTARPPWYVMPLYRTSLASECPTLVGNEVRIRGVFAAVLEGVQYAHAQGVLHRDLKPENILLNTDSDIVITDFGLGRALDSPTERVTRTGDRFGTPGYSAPEQYVNAKLCDERTDVFALGRILYELYSGNNPIAAQDLGLVSPGIALIIDRCTKANPKERFGSVGELRLALSNLFSSMDRLTTEDEIGRLQATALAEGTLQIEDATKLAACIEAVIDDVDLLQDICVTLPAGALQSLWTVNPYVVKRLVNAFADLVAGQSWGFSHVDSLGEACVRIFKSIEDANVRARAAFAVVEVSVSHNRWYAMDLAAKLLLAVRRPEDDLAIAQALSPLKSQVRALESRLKLGRLRPNIAALLMPED